MPFPHVNTPSRAGFKFSEANSEITTKARAAIGMAVDALIRVRTLISGKPDEVIHDEGLHDDMLVEMFYGLAKSLARRSLAYRQVVIQRLGANKLEDLAYFKVHGWILASGEVKGVTTVFYEATRRYLPLNEESAKRIKDGPYDLRTGLRAAREISASAVSGGLLMPSVREAVASYTVTLKASVFHPFVTVPGVAEEQPGSTLAGQFIAALFDAAMRSATRKLQALHAGMIEGRTEKVSLFKSHKRAHDEHPHLYSLGVAIGDQMAVRRDNLPKVKEFLKKIKEKVGGGDIILPDIKPETDPSEISDQIRTSMVNFGNLL